MRDVGQGDPTGTCADLNTLYVGLAQAIGYSITAEEMTG